jgi:hypothetical protein
MNPVTTAKPNKAVRRLRKRSQERRHGPAGNVAVVDIRDVPLARAAREAATAGETDGKGEEAGAGKVGDAGDGVEDMDRQVWRAITAAAAD